MREIREPATIIEELRDLDKLISSANEFLVENPEDEIITFLLGQNKYRREILLGELKEAHQKSGKHNLKFIFKDFISSLDLRQLIDNLKTFQDLLDNTLEHVTNHKKKIFPVDFHTVFTGSLGILMSSTSDDKFLDSDYDSTLVFFFETIEEIKKNRENINKIIERRFNKDAKLISKYVKLFEKIINTDSSVSIEWDDIELKTKTVDISLDFVKEVYTLLKNYEHKKVEIIQIEGRIRAVDLTNYTLKIESVNDENTKITKASFEKSLYSSVLDNIDVECDFVVETTRTYNEATSKEETRNKIRNIKRSK
jgi:hypothetical protein